MSSIFSKFTKCYKPTSKTLRFTLIPQGKTQEHITKSGILSQDLTRVNYYNEVKSALDEVHKKFIEESLLDVSLNWQELYDAHEEYRLTKNDENLKNTRLKYIKNLVVHFKDKQKNFELEPAKIISKLLNGTICIDNCNLDAIKQFDRFATYFEGYKENRNNVYGEQQNSVAYRVVVENFSKFYSNLKKYYALPDEIKATLNNSIKLIFDNIDLNTVFSIENFNDYIAQSGIDKYNTIIGGISKDVNNKIQGLNEICNLEYQQGRLNKKVVFDVLYKQILSDRQTLSFIEESYQNDKDLLTDLDSHLFELNKFLEDSFANVINLLTNNNCNFSYIYVDKKQMPVISKMIYDNWFILEEKFAKKSKLYSVESIIKVSENYAVLQLINNRLKEAYNQFITAYASVKKVLCKNVICSYDEIKECLDTIISLEKLLKLLIVNTDDEKDDEFYSIYEPFYNKVRESISVYNRVRNYATKKEYLDEKVKINFDSPTLCNGWDQNKEKDYNCIILLKNNNYYLGVYNKNNRAFVEESEEATDDNCYKKMIYKLLPDPKRSKKRVFIACC